jgi:hypothetical protein
LVFHVSTYKFSHSLKIWNSFPNIDESIFAMRALMDI